MKRVIDPETEFGARCARRLREDMIAWLITAGGDGTPQPNPVWFVWDGATLLVYSEPGQAKLKHIARNPRVAVHLDSRNSGDDIVIITGTAAVDTSAPPADQDSEYVRKYRDEMVRLNLGSPEEMARTYSAAIRITPTKVRGF